jgi:hypothetical protein
MVDTYPLVQQDEPRTGVMRGGGRVLLRPLDLGSLAVDGGDLDDLAVEQDEVAGAKLLKSSAVIEVACSSIAALKVVWMGAVSS